MWIIFIIMFVLVGGGWIAYWFWEYRIRMEEKAIPPDQKRGDRAKSERLQQAEKTFEEYAKKMVEFKKRPYGGSKP